VISSASQTHLVVVLVGSVHEEVAAASRRVSSDVDVVIVVVERLVA